MPEEQTSQASTEDVIQTQDDSSQDNEQQSDNTELQDKFYGKADDENQDDAEDSDNEDQDSDDSDEESKDSDDDSNDESEDQDQEDDKADDKDEKDGDKKEGDDEKLELTKPEDAKLSDADMERIAAYAKEQGLSKEAAQKLVEQQDAAIKDFYQGLQTQVREQSKQWIEDIKTDKELGGENLELNVRRANWTMKKYGTELFRKDLDKTKYGNYPEFVRFCARVGRDLMPKEEFKGNPSGGSDNFAEKFYGSKQN